MQQNFTLVYVCVFVFSLVVLKNMMIALPEPGAIDMQKHMFSYVHSENVYSFFNDAINLKKGKLYILKITKRWFIRCLEQCESK